MTGHPAAMAGAAPSVGGPVPLSLPAPELSVVAADIAEAPVVGWLRALAGWAGSGRAVAAFARVRAAGMPEVSALPGIR